MTAVAPTKGVTPFIFKRNALGMGVDAWCGNSEGCTTSFKVQWNPIIPFGTLGFKTGGIRKNKFRSNYVFLGVISNRKECVCRPTFRDGLESRVVIENLVTRFKTGVTTVKWERNT